VAEDSTTTQPEADAPAEADTPTPPALDTDANTQQSPKPTDWEARYKAIQAENTRKSQALIAKEKEIADLRLAREEDDEEEEEEPTRARKSSRRSAEIADYEERLAEAEWTIARAIYDEPTITAYASAATLLDQAKTASDHVAAFEAYHQARLGGATPEEATPRGAPPPAAVQPRADSNRSDAPVLPEIEQKLREAEKKRDLGSWVSAKLAGG
jgi:hypothetical protein